MEQSKFFPGLEKGEKKGPGVWAGWLHGFLSIISIEVKRHSRMALGLSTEDKGWGSRARPLCPTCAPETAERAA